MIDSNKKNEICFIWDNYIKSNKVVLDTKGKEIEDIRKLRLEAITHVKKLISEFIDNSLDIYEFKTNLDSYNKRNNLWGFTATKGQMFFNQLVKTNQNNIEKLAETLKNCISEPSDLENALSKIELLENICFKVFSKAKDKRKVPNPGSVSYFLSYFWQIHDNEKWPILYTSLTKAYEKLGIWEDQKGQVSTYKYFYKLNEEIKKILVVYSKKEITNWDAEHAFWSFNGNPNKKVEKKKAITAEANIETVNQSLVTIKATFSLTEYLIPKVSTLVDLGADSDKTASAKGSEFEKLVGEIFKQLDFEVEMLGQGKGRNPDIIVKFREENTAFIIDAKAYSDGYSLGLDDRAIKEYINHHCPMLQKEGYKKIGFIIVSNSFKSNFDSFINDITWNTDIKRFVLLTSEALLYLLAYKTKDRLSLSSMIESLISFGNPVIAQNIIGKFDDI